MTDLTVVQMISLMLVFVWSGFVRAGLGFGGAALALPFALIVVESGQVAPPLLLMQLILFSGLHTVQHWDNVDRRYLGCLAALLVLPVLAGVYSLIKLPNHGLMTLVYLFVLGIAIQYIVQMEFKTVSRAVDGVLLMLEGYVLGSTTAGDPPIVAVSMRYVHPSQVRDTLLCLWLIFAALNLVVLIRAEVDLQWRAQVWLLPATVVGHLIGDRVHGRLIAMQNAVFDRVLGVALFLVTILGLVKLWR